MQKQFKLSASFATDLFRFPHKPNGAGRVEPKLSILHRGWLDHFGRVAYSASYARFWAMSLSNC